MSNIKLSVNNGSTRLIQHISLASDAPALFERTKPSENISEVSIGIFHSLQSWWKHTVYNKRKAIAMPRITEITDSNSDILL